MNYLKQQRCGLHPLHCIAAGVLLGMQRGGFRLRRSVHERFCGCADVPDQPTVNEDDSSLETLLDGCGVQTFCKFCLVRLHRPSSNELQWNQLQQTQRSTLSRSNHDSNQP